MTILLVDSTQILLKSAYIAEIVANPGVYDKIKISATINCCDTPTELTIDLPQTLNTDKVQFSGNDLLIHPKFFGLTEFVDGIYKFTFTRIDTGVGVITESNCIFVDVTYKCKVANLLKFILEENKTKNNNEKLSTIAHLLHYSLFNGSNCGCNCEEMCKVFNELTNILNINSQITNNCEC